LIKHIAILIFILININPVLAQFTGFGNDQSYQSAITVYDIDKLPPIQDEMIYETKFSYIYVDSIARACNQNYVEHFPVNCSTDSLKFLTSICSNIHSFDEALLRSYTGKTSQLMLNDSIYQSCPIRVLASTSSWVKQY
jgi:hypothetical protein